MKTLVIKTDNSTKVIDISAPFSRNLERKLGYQVKYYPMKGPFAYYPTCMAVHRAVYTCGLSFNYLASMFCGFLVFGDAAIVKDDPDEGFPIEAYIMSDEEVDMLTKCAHDILSNPAKYQKDIDAMNAVLGLYYKRAS